MKSICLSCLLAIFISTMVLAQSNPVPLPNQPGVSRIFLRYCKEQLSPNAGPERLRRLHPCQAPRKRQG